MGIDIGRAILALMGEGIRVQRGYPGILMPHLTGAVVAVNVWEDEPYKTTLVAEICAPMTMGIYACEDMAIRVSNCWKGISGECSFGDKGFDSKSGLYFMKVKGVWWKEDRISTEAET